MDKCVCGHLRWEDHSWIGLCSKCRCGRERDEIQDAWDLLLSNLDKENDERHRG